MKSKIPPCLFEPPNQRDHFVVKQRKRSSYFHQKPVILASVVLSQYANVSDDDDRQTERQTTLYDNSRKLHCNGQLKTVQMSNPAIYFTEHRSRSKGVDVIAVIRPKCVNCGL